MPKKKIEAFSEWPELADVSVHIGFEDETSIRLGFTLAEATTLLTQLNLAVATATQRIADYDNYVKTQEANGGRP